MEQGTQQHPGTQLTWKEALLKKMHPVCVIIIAIIVIVIPYLVEPKTPVVRHVIILCATKKKPLPFNLQ